MDAASRQFVNIDELMDGVRRRIATLTGAEDGIVTAGSAAAIAIATAAALAANDPVKMLRLPHDVPKRSRVLMNKSHRFPYDQAMRMTGADVVEIEDAADLEQIDPSRIAMIAFLASRDSMATLSLDQFAAFGRRHRIPVLVDAAPLPIRRPDNWLARGADLVVYSGGKLLCGPPGSGLLIGRRDLIDAAWANSPPHHSFGRPMKIGKEAIVGLVAALEAWFLRDEAADRRRWRDYCADIADAIHPVPGAAAEIVPPDEGEDAPLLQLTWTGRLHGLELRRRLLEGRPRIMLDDISAGPGRIKLEVVSLRPGEATLVGKAIATVLMEPVEEHEERRPAVDVSGDWEFDVQFAGHTRRHQVSLSAEGDTVTGHQKSPDFLGSVTGQIHGSTLHLVFEDEYQSAIITYRFTGHVACDRLSGEVVLGSATPHSRGEVNYGQYGKVQWRGRRIG